MLPMLNGISQSKDMLQSFEGLNKEEIIKENECSSMMNMTNDYYPVLSTREKRRTKTSIGIDGNGMYAKEGIIRVEGTTITYNKDDGTTITINNGLTNSKKQIVGIGSYVCFFPDKKYFSISDTNPTLKSMENTFTSTSDIAFNICTLEGQDIGAVSYDLTKPSDPYNGSYWCNANDEYKVYIYSSESKDWAFVDTYISIETDGIGNVFNVGDCVSLSGVKDPTSQDTGGKNPDFYIGVGNKLNVDTLVQMNKSTDKIIVSGKLPGYFFQASTKPITLKRKCPDMDYVTECNNRIWGCSSSNHEIYACKLGDVTNWYCYAGITSDSYAATVGSDGKFTGVTTHLGKVLFFKEDEIIKVYGSKPSEYQLDSTKVSGVEKGSSRSMQIINEYLYYKSKAGFMVYNGSVVSNISEKLGYGYTNVVSGQYKNKYYASCIKDGTYHVLVYDTKKQLWCEEDDSLFEYCVTHNNVMYIWDEPYIMTLGSETGTLENNLNWEAIFGEYGLSSPDKKYISRLQIRAAVLAGQMSVYIEYEKSGNWIKVAEINETVRKTVLIPINIKRCEIMRLKICGYGETRIYGIAKLTEQGSDG